MVVGGDVGAGGDHEQMLAVPQEVGVGEGSLVDERPGVLPDLASRSRRKMVCRLVAGWTRPAHQVPSANHSLDWDLVAVGPSTTSVSNTKFR